MATATNTTWQGRQLIDGHWRQSAVESFESFNPANFAEVVGVYPRGTAADVDTAVAAARRAFGPWRRMSRIKRGELFNRLAQLIEQDVDELAAVIARESGKLLNEARAEVIEGLHMVQYVFGTARMPTGQVIASEIEAKDLYERRKPRGVVAVITPWNFPFAVPLWMLGPSLLEGNTTVFKPSEETPEIGTRLAALFVDAGFPNGTINLVHGLGHDVGEALARHDDVDVVAFTGSYEVGAKIRRWAAESDHKTCALRDGFEERRHRLRRRRSRSGRECGNFKRLQDQWSTLRLGRSNLGASWTRRSVCNEFRGPCPTFTIRRPVRSGEF